MDESIRGTVVSLVDPAKATENVDSAVAPLIRSDPPGALIVEGYTEGRPQAFRLLWENSGNQKQRGHALAKPASNAVHNDAVVGQVAQCLSRGDAVMVDWSSGEMVGVVSLPGVAVVVRQEGPPNQDAQVVAHQARMMPTGDDGTSYTSLIFQRLYRYPTVRDMSALDSLVGPDGPLGFCIGDKSRAVPTTATQPTLKCLQETPGLLPEFFVDWTVTIPATALPPPGSVFRVANDYYEVMFQGSLAALQKVLHGKNKRILSSGTDTLASMVPVDDWCISWKGCTKLSCKATLERLASGKATSSEAGCQCYGSPSVYEAYTAMTTLFQTLGWSRVRVRELFGGMSGSKVLMAMGYRAGELQVPIVVKMDGAEDISNEYKIHVNILENSPLSRNAPKKVHLCLGVSETLGAMSIELCGASNRVVKYAANYSVDTLRDLIHSDFDLANGGAAGLSVHVSGMTGSAAIQKLFLVLMKTVTVDERDIGTEGGAKNLKSLGIDIVLAARRRVLDVPKENSKYKKLTEMDQRVGFMSELKSLAETLESNITSPLWDTEAPMGLVHGDLNGRNVLVDTAGIIWVIDFAHTGQGHILNDLAKVEQCVLLEYAWPNDRCPPSDKDAFLSLVMWLYGPLDPTTLMPAETESGRWTSNVRTRHAADMVRSLRSLCVRFLRERHVETESAPMHFFTAVLPYLLKAVTFKTVLDSPQLVEMEIASIAVLQSMRSLTNGPTARGPPDDSRKSSIGARIHFPDALKALARYGTSLRAMCEHIADPVTGDMVSTLFECVPVSVIPLPGPGTTERKPRSLIGELLFRKCPMRGGVWIIAPAASGKTTATKQLMLAAIMHSPPQPDESNPAIVPVFIPMASLALVHKQRGGWMPSGPVPADRRVDFLIEVMGSVADMNGWPSDVLNLIIAAIVNPESGSATMRGLTMGLLVLDGFDEVSPSYMTAMLEFASALLTHTGSRALCVMTSRPTALFSGSMSEIPRNLAGSPRYAPVEFVERERRLYSLARLGSESDTDQFLGALRGQAAALEMASSPLLLTLLLHVFQALQGRLPDTIVGLYEESVRLILARVVRPGSDMGEQGIDDIRLYLSAVAFESKIVRNARDVVPILRDSRDGVDNPVLTSLKVRCSRDLAWVEKLVISGGIPLLEPTDSMSGRLCFAHYSWAEYLAACFLVEEVRIPAPGPYTALASVQLNDENCGDVLFYAAEMVVGRSDPGEDLDTKLQEIVLASANSENLFGGFASSNAAGILVRAGVPFSNMDLSGVQLAGASLCTGVFHKSNLQKACLDGADLRSSILTEADLRGASLKDIRIGGSSPVLDMGAPIYALDIATANHDGGYAGVLWIGGDLIPMNSEWTPLIEDAQRNVEEVVRRGMYEVMPADRMWNGVPGLAHAGLSGGAFNDGSGGVTVSMSPDGTTVCAGPVGSIGGEQYLYIASLRSLSHACSQYVGFHQQIDVHWKNDGGRWCWTAVTCSGRTLGPPTTDEHSIRIIEERGTGCLPLSVPKPTGAVRCARFVDGTNRIVTLCSLGYVRFLTVEENGLREESSFRCGSGCSSVWPWFLGGSWCTVVSIDTRLEVWMMMDGHWNDALTIDLPGQATQVQPGVNDSELVIGTKTGVIQTWKIDSSSKAATVQDSHSVHSGPVSSLAVSSRSGKVIAGGFDGIMYVASARSHAGAGSESEGGQNFGGDLKWMKGHRGRITGVAVSLNGRFCVTCGEDCVALVWDIARGAMCRPLVAHTAPLCCVAASTETDGCPHYVTADQSDNIIFWASKTGRPLYRIRMQEAYRHRSWQDPSHKGPRGIWFNGTLLAVHYLYEVILVAVDIDNLDHQLHRVILEDSMITTVSFSKDGDRLVIGTSTGSMRVWDILHETYDCPQYITLQASGPPITGAVISLKGNEVYAVVGDELISYFIAGGAVVWTVRLEEELRSGLLLARTGRILVTYSDHGLVQWRLQVNGPPSIHARMNLGGKHSVRSAAVSCDASVMAMTTSTSVTIVATGTDGTAVVVGRYARYPPELLCTGLVLEHSLNLNDEARDRLVSKGGEVVEVFHPRKSLVTRSGSAVRVDAALAAALMASSSIEKPTSMHWRRVLQFCAGVCGMVVPFIWPTAVLLTPLPIHVRIPTASYRMLGVSSFFFEALVIIMMLFWLPIPALACKLLAAVCAVSAANGADPVPSPPGREHSAVGGRWQSTVEARGLVLKWAYGLHPRLAHRTCAHPDSLVIWRDRQNRVASLEMRVIFWVGLFIPGVWFAAARYLPKRRILYKHLDILYIACQMWAVLQIAALMEVVLGPSAIVITVLCLGVAYLLKTRDEVTMFVVVVNIFCIGLYIPPLWWFAAYYVRTHWHPYIVILATGVAICAMVWTTLLLLNPMMGAVAWGVGLHFLARYLRDQDAGVVDIYAALGVRCMYLRENFTKVWLAG